MDRSKKSKETRRRWEEKHKEELAAYRKAWREANKEHLKAYQKAWKSGNKPKLKHYRTFGAQMFHNRERCWKRKGLDYEFLGFLDKLATQRFKCAICRESVGVGGHLDHDHSTGKPREILCSTCNTGLGCFRDSPELLGLAATYANKWKGVQ